MYARSLIGAFATLLWLAGQAQAACYADYKASRDNPFKLHYGVIRIDVNPCTLSDQVVHDVAERLKASGWKLLQVRSVFGEGGLEQRREDAGQYFLRF
ncbi:MAG: hypothetical protein F4X97_09205 [Boseongicola sp. SB0662_bin_57]|nr:hypothetical protein [Boseongicola sp. SB0662_bin_57]